MGTTAGPMRGQDRHRSGGLFGGFSRSQVIYLGLVAAMLLLQLLKTVLPLEVNPGQQTSWIQIAIVSLLGWIGVWLSPRTGFPGMWDENVSQRQRFIWPALSGLGLGLLLVLLDLRSPLGTELQSAFPGSLIVYSLGGLIEEIEIHLFALPLLIWLISGLLLRGRHQTAVFWTVAIVGGLAYWGLQIYGISQFMPEQLTPTFAAQLLIIVAGSITLGAVFFRRGGFLAALTLRYAIYVVWHILWAGGIGLISWFQGL